MQKKVCGATKGIGIFTTDLAMAAEGVTTLLENKNLVFLGTSMENGYDPLPFAIGTCDNNSSRDQTKQNTSN